VKKELRQNPIFEKLGSTSDQGQLIVIKVTVDTSSLQENNA
jgi:hypothetical protein